MATNADAILYNEFFYNYTGRDPEFMRNWAWQDFLPLEEIPRVATSMYHALDTGQNWECAYPLRARDGTYREILVKAAPLYNKKGEIKYWIGGGMDITNLTKPQKLMKR